MAQPVDTLSVSQSMVDAFTQQPAYDYKRELVHTETNYLDEFLRWLEELFSTEANAASNVNWNTAWWLVAMTVLVLLLFWWLYRTRFALFAGRDDGEELEYEVEIDNIHEIDYEGRLATARQSGDHREVCRLLYLQTLKKLADGGLIDWRPFKTPSQYNREVNDPQMHAMTNAFLRVRYGNFDASEQLCAQMQEWQRHVVDLIPGSEQEKGGGAT